MDEYYMKNLQGLNNDNSLDQDGFTKISQLELLSEKELGFFSNDTMSKTNSRTDTGADARHSRVDATDSPELTHIAPIIAVDENSDKSRDEIAFCSREPLNPYRTPYLNSRKNAHTTISLFNKIKLLTTGLIGGLLLSMIMVIVLHKVGALAMLTPSATQILGVENKKQNMAANATSQTNTQDTFKLPAAPVATQPLIGTAQQQTNHNSSISNEDFQREAQSTLYRETND